MYPLPELNPRTFLFRLEMCSLIIGKYAFILPRGSMIVVRYGASCIVVHNRSSQSDVKWTTAVVFTHHFPRNTSIKIFDCSLVSVGCDCAVRGLVGSTIEDVNGVR